MGKEFEVRFEGLLPADPAAVWDAITGATAAWCWPIAYEPRLGGSEVGLTPHGGTVTAWEPPRHFATWAEGKDGWHNKLDYRIEARDGGTDLRLVHSGVILDNWDIEYDACRQHTAFYYHSLGQYLKYFQGRPATYLTAEGPAASAGPDAFEVLRRALGLADQVSPGLRVRLEVPGLDTLDGVVDYLTPNFLGLRTSDGLYRFYGRNAFGWRLGIGHHLFAAGVDREKAERAWAAWLDGLYG